MYCLSSAFFVSPLQLGDDESQLGQPMAWNSSLAVKNFYLLLGKTAGDKTEEMGWK